MKTIVPHGALGCQAKRSLPTPYHVVLARSIRCRHGALRARACPGSRRDIERYLWAACARGAIVFFRPQLGCKHRGPSSRRTHESLHGRINSKSGPRSRTCRRCSQLQLLAIRIRAVVCRVSEGHRMLVKNGIKASVDHARAAASALQRACVRIDTEFSSRHKRHSAVFGAGFYGAFLLARMPDRSAVACCIDNNPHLWGKTLFGVPVASPEMLPTSTEIVYVG